MAFLGLFIGIDRYASSQINWLGCAKRDAVAMHALFSDTLGDGATLLTDENATKANIQARFNDLKQCNSDDVVVIFFSGHGTNTHELVTYDTEIRRLEETSIPLDELTNWFKEIPAHRLVCILDCCFSGGMGAKVLTIDAVSRGITSTDALLDQLSGNGRIVFTASTPDEEAYEKSSIGHGLLTFYLLEALQGAEEVREAGKVSVYRLLEYVTQRVKSDAAQLGKVQHPTLRATMDDALTFPIFTAGKLYYSAFPELKPIVVTKDIQSLELYGFPAPLIDAWRGAIPSLNQLQLDAINEYKLLQGDHLVVSAPTSSGKTMIGELAALKGCLEHKRAFFLLPLKALVNDKHQQFNRLYGEFGIKTIRATGEITDDVPDLIKGRYDICLMTYEKFSALVLAFPHLLEQVGTVIVDEVQMIADPSRGANLEFILTLLRVRRQDAINPQLIALSAVIGDTNGLERWLGARLLLRTERPVPLDEGVLRADGSFRYIDPDGNEHVDANHIQRRFGKNSSQDWIIPLVQKLVSEDKQVIVFREVRGETRGCALYLARDLGLAPAQVTLDGLPVGDLSSASQALRQALQGGVAFHNSNLSHDERLVIEEQFRAPNSSLRVIVATTTLAMGVNTPAEAVVVVGLNHPGAVPTPYTIAEYKNIVGRAGRLGFSERGTSYLLALTQHDEHKAWTRYIQGQPEDIHSRFLDRATDPRSLIVRVLVAAQRFAGQGMTADEIIAFLEGSFGAYQQMQVANGWTWNRVQLQDALRSLETHNLIELIGSQYKLTELGTLSGETGVEVETIIRLVNALSPVAPNNLTEPTLIAATQLSVELDDVYFPMNKKSTRKEPQFWSYQLRQQNVAQSVVNNMHHNVTERHQPTLRAKKASCCLLWMSTTPLAEIERLVTQFGGASGGAAGSVRSVRARTGDILPVVIRVAELLHPSVSFGERATELMTRLEIGVPDVVVELAMVAGGRLSRADYFQLIGAGLNTVEAIENCDDQTILDCFDGQQNNADKLGVLRDAVTSYHERIENDIPLVSVIPPYSGAK